jgi:GT2 family glycosyltransferase
MSERPRVYAVVVDWNGAERTAACLRALEAVDHPHLAIVAVDNGSDPPRLADRVGPSPRVHVIRADRNLGFSGGCNLGIHVARRAGADYVWLINNDAVPEPDALAAMLAVAEEDSRIGAVGCLLLEEERGRPVRIFGGGSVSFWSGLPRHHTRAVSADRIQYLRGASVLLRRAALDAVGALDERFFLYWEDTDLSFRLRAAGWRLAVADAAIVRHRGNGSLAMRSPGWDFHFTASAALFFRGHAPVPLWPIAVSTSERMAKRVLRGRWENARAVWRGFRAGTRGTRATSPEPELALP